ncbi:MAG: acetate/propionate family kinase [Pseudomonadota bacterium]
MSAPVVLTVNAGSSSVKTAAYEIADGAPTNPPLLRAHLASIGEDPQILLKEAAGSEEVVRAPEATGDYDAAFRALLARLERRLDGRAPAAIAHRVVHGGPHYAEPVRLDAEALRALEALSPLAPGHQPHNLHGVRAAEAWWPDAPHFACFDTAFHRTMPEAAQRFALPRALHEEGIRRYGFHGLSYEHIARVAPQVIGALPHDRMIVAHLGSGASLCAVKSGLSVATTMGFTALDGLPMSTRCGDLDPGVVLHLLLEKSMSAADVAQLLNRKSGLLGVSGVSGDMRVLEESDAPEADEAIELFAYRCANSIGALTAALGGLDALVFTAGIGENSVRVRAEILARCAWLGVRIDPAANARHRARIDDGEGPVSAWVIATDEEYELARVAAERSA